MILHFEVRGKLQTKLAHERSCNRVTLFRILERHISPATVLTDLILLHLVMKFGTGRSDIPTTGIFEYSCANLTIIVPDVRVLITMYKHDF